MGNSKTYAVWAAIVIIAGAAGVYGWHRHSTNKGDNSPQAAVESKNEKTESAPSQNQRQVLEGTLKASDNQQRGNLMLVTSDRTLYIYTSRDFNSLIEKQVKVTYDGTLDNFRLGNIVEK